jgi:hypothetical protein
MTTICYRAGIMAGDYAWSDSEVNVFFSRSNKIHRLPSGALYGGSGDVDDRALVAKLFDVVDPDNLPTSGVYACRPDDDRNRHGRHGRGGERLSGGRACV